MMSSPIDKYALPTELSFKEGLRIYFRRTALFLIVILGFSFPLLLIALTHQPSPDKQTERITLIIELQPHIEELLVVDASRPQYLL
jgi:hypothetical protein